MGDALESVDVHKRNAVLPPEVQRFLDKWAKHLSLSISIDGDKQLHDSCRVFPDGSGSYDLAIAAAKDY